MHTSPTASLGQDGNGGQGALIGAGIGLLLGAASEPAYEAPRYVAPPRTSYVQQMQAQAPQQVTIINNYYVTAAPTTGGYKTDAGAY